MICAKNYETVSKFVKVMPRILWPLFIGHGVVNLLLLIQVVGLLMLLLLLINYHFLPSVNIIPRELDVLSVYSGGISSSHPGFK